MLFLILVLNLFYFTYQEALANYFFPPGVETLGSVNGVESSGSFSPVSHNLVNLDGHISDLSYDDNNEYFDSYPDDFMDADDYAIVQDHLDKMDIPPGIEAAIPWLPDFTQCKKNPITGSSSQYAGTEMHLDVVGLHGLDSSLPSWSSKPAHVSMKPTSVGNSSMQTQMDTVIHPPEMDLSSSCYHSQVAQNKKKSSASKHRGSALNLPVGKESSKSRWFLEPFKSKKKPVASSGSTNHSYVNQLDPVPPSHGVDSSIWGHSISKNAKKQVGVSSTYYPNYTDALHYPHGSDPSTPLWQESFKDKMKASLTNHTIQGFYVPFHGLPAAAEEVADVPWAQDSAQNQNNAAADGSSTFHVEAIAGGVKEEILRRFCLFKQFDTVEDHSDHHYSGHGSSMKQVTRFR
jgi:ubiquitin-conjugating enzyme E2 O